MAPLRARPPTKAAATLATSRRQTAAPSNATAGGGPKAAPSNTKAALSSEGGFRKGALRAIESKMAVVDHVSDTARWVAAYRAMESERKDALFRDPFARTLAGDVGFAIARSLPGGMKSAASAVVARTC